MASTELPSSMPNVVGSLRMEMLASYRKEPGEKLGVLARTLLEGYSKIPPDDVESHVKKIVRTFLSPKRLILSDLELTCRQRDEAWDIFPYPCIGGFRFLDL